MDWEMKAKQMAEDLRTVAVGLLAACVWLAFEVEGSLVVAPVVGALAALGALRGGRIAP